MAIIRPKADIKAGPIKSKRPKTPIVNVHVEKDSDTKDAAKGKKKTRNILGSKPDPELKGRINVKFKKGMTQEQRKKYQVKEHKRVHAKRKTHKVERGILKRDKEKGG